MKICQINCVYGEGSTGKIVKDIHQTLLENNYDSICITPITPEHCALDAGVYSVSNKFLSKLSAIYRRLLGLQFDGAYIQTSRIIKILKKEEPNVVHLHCINGNNINVYRLYDYLANNHIKTILTLHAEFPYTGGCGHAYDCLQWETGCEKCPILREATQSIFFDFTKRTWKKQKNCYDKFEREELIITAVSPWLISRAQKSPMLSRFSMIPVLNGVDTTVFYPHKNSGWREKLGIKKEEKILFYATASFRPYEDNLKGGKYILQLADMLREEKVKIVVAANFAQVDQLPENVIYIGRTKTQIELAELYSEADLSVITSKRETFSMPVAESLCCGTPIVGFEAGGPESIAMQEYSEFVEYGNVNALAMVVDKWLQKSYDASKMSHEASTLYSKETMTSNYLKVYNK